MENTRFLQPLYSDRSEKYEIRNFETAVAEQFAREMVDRAGLSAQNMAEFLDNDKTRDDGYSEADSHP